MEITEVSLHDDGGQVSHVFQSGDGLEIRPLDALGFLGAQFAVIGPLVFGAFLAILVMARRSPLRREDRLMLALAIRCSRSSLR